MSNQIPLHKARGLDPHIMSCPRCGEDNGALTVGRIVCVETTEGNHYAYQRDVPRIRRELVSDVRVVRVRDVDERETIPGDLCQSCVDELAVFREEVEAGGVYWRCETCTQQGVIKAGSEISNRVRESTGIGAPDPVGLTFEDCSQHPNKE